MHLRSLAALTLTSTLALGLAACEVKDSDDTGLTNNPSNPVTSNTMSDPTAGTDTDTDPVTGTDAETTNIVTSGMSDSTTTTANPSEVTETTATVTTVPPDTSASETGPLDTSASETGPDPSGTSTGGGGFDGEFGPCEMMDPPCVGDAQCVTVTDVEGNFCSPACDMAHPCPPPPEGTAQPMCLLSLEMSMDATNCAYVCDPMMMGQCPAGSTCKPIQGVGVCTFP